MRNLPSEMERLLREAVSEHELSPFYDDIRKAARLTFLLFVEPAMDDSAVGLGASRLGGAPDLPAGLSWAHEKNDEAENEAPDGEASLLTFIGQINFAELPQLGQPLPSRGMMYVYSQQDGAAENEHLIQFYEGPINSLQRQPTPSPELFADECDDEPFGVVVVKEFVPSVSLPDSLNKFTNFSDDAHDSYSEMLSRLHGDPRQKEPTSRLLGYPFDPYGRAEVSEDCELLLEAQSFFHNGQCLMNFWDAGCLQILADAPALRRGEFRNTKANIVSP